MKISDIGEVALIRHMASCLEENPRVVKGIGDDTAVLPGVGDRDILFTTDMMVEGVHFSREFGTLFSAGKKAIAVNASDIAAMGGEPNFAVVSIALPESLKTEEVNSIYRGFNERAQEYGIFIVGGDTVKARDIVINIALLGEVESGKAVYRSGAAEGDIIFVTGSLGKSAAGLYACTNPEAGVDLKSREFARENHLEPRARVVAGKELGASEIVSAMNDVSDGLSSELYEICNASNKGCEIDLDAVPVDPRVKDMAGAAGISPLEWAFYGGEDFELIFTTPPSKGEEVKDLFKKLDLPVTIIGKIKENRYGMYGRDRDGKKIDIIAGGYQHFKS